MGALEAAAAERTMSLGFINGMAGGNRGLEVVFEPAFALKVSWERADILRKIFCSPPGLVDSVYQTTSII